MKKILFVLFTFASLISWGQKEKSTTLSSNVARATVFFQGAQLFQSQKTTLKPGRNLIVFEKLTDFLDPNSVQVKAVGNLTILNVRTQKNFEDLKITNDEIDELLSKRTKLEDREEILTNEYVVLANDRELLMKNRDLKGTNTGLSVDELKAAYTFMHDKMTLITSRQTEIEREVEDLVKEMNQIDQEIISRRSKPVTNYSEVVIEVDVASTTEAEFFVSYITPNASWTPYYDLRSNGIGQPIQLEAKALVSQTTGIEWKDIELTLSTNDPYQNSQEPTLEPWYINYYNQPQRFTKQQRTTPQFKYDGQTLRGEVLDAETMEPLPFTQITFPGYTNVGAVTDFDGKFEVVVPQGAKTVQARYLGYSLANQTINSPYLKFFLNPERQELSEVVVTSNRQLSTDDVKMAPTRTLGVAGSTKRKIGKGKEQSSTSDWGYSSGAGNYAQNVSTVVAQKDLRVEYKIQSKFTIPSNGVEQRVSISSHELPASYEYHSVPKIDPAVYLVAQTTGWEKLNLLNGESNLYFDGTFIGKTYVDANSLKDTLTFSLGKDNKMQIERKRISELSSNRVIGSRRKYEVAWEINVRNNGGANIPLLIKDQFPISTQEDIKVKIGEYENGQLDDKTKIITWKTNIAPGSKQSFKFDYKVDYNASYPVYIE